MEGIINSILLSKDILFVTWEVPYFTEILFEDYFEQKYSTKISAIRIYDVTSIIFDGSNAHYCQETMIGHKQSNWTFKKLKPNRNYCVEVGIKLTENQFFPLLRSNTVRTQGTKNTVENEYSKELFSSTETDVSRRDWNSLVSTYSYYGNSLPSFIYERVKEHQHFKKVNIHKKILVEQADLLFESNKRKKILLLTWEFPPHIIGGLARHVHGLARGLQKQGYEVHVITANPNQWKQEEIDYGIHIYRVKPLMEKDKDFLSWIGGLNLAITAKAMELVKNHLFTLIHAHDWLVGASGRTLQGFLGLPLVVTIHATEYGRNNGIYTELQRFIHEKEQQLIKQADHLIVCSNYMKKELYHIFSMKKNQRISMIPNGVEELDNKESSHEVLSTIPIQENKRLIFSIGRIVSEKGFDTFIEAAAKLCLICPDVYFIIAGKGPMLDEYRNKVVQMQLQDIVFFIGFVTDEQRNALFSKCTMAVFPSRYEPFGIVAIESLSRGIPTIVSNIGGLKEIVHHKENGLLMEAGNADSLMEQAIYFLENESKASLIGSNGKKIVDKLFSWGKIANETSNVYSEVKVMMELKTCNKTKRQEQFPSDSKKGIEMIPGIWIAGKMYWLNSGTEELMNEEGISMQVEQEEWQSNLQSFKINITNHHERSKDVKLLIQNRYQHEDNNHFSFISPADNVVFHLIDHHVYLIDGFSNGMIRGACSVQPIRDIYMDRIWSCSKVGKLKYNPMANGNAASILLYNMNLKGIETFEGKTWIIKGENEKELIKLNEALLKTY